MKKPKLEVSATRKNDDWVTVDEMKQEERLVNDICKVCKKKLDEVDIAWTWEDLCFDCEIDAKLSET